MEKRLIFTLAFLSLILVPYALAATASKTQFNLFEGFGDGIIKGLATVTGYEPEELLFPQVTYLVLFPIVVTTAIVLGFMEMIKIFNKTPYVNYIISIAASMTFLFVGGTKQLVFWMTFLIGGGAFIVGGLVGLIAIGIIFWNHTGGIKSLKDLEKKVHSVEVDLDKLRIQEIDLVHKIELLAPTQRPTTAGGTHPGAGDKIFVKLATDLKAIQASIQVKEMEKTKIEKKMQEGESAVQKRFLSTASKAIP